MLENPKFPSLLSNQKSYLRAVSPTSLSTLERSARAGFRNFRGLVPVPDSRRAVFEAKCWKIPCFARNSLIGSRICVPSVPTSLSTQLRSSRAGFRIFRGLFPVLDPRRAVFEPKCWKIPCFIHNDLTGRSPICVPLVPTSLSTLERSARAGFGIFRGMFFFPDTCLAVFERKRWKIPCFARNSIIGSPICVPLVPTCLSILVRSAHVGFGIFRGPFSVPYPRRAVFGPKCWKIPSFVRNYRTGSPICVLSVPTSLSSLERSAPARFEIFHGPFSVPDTRRAVFEPKCWKIPSFPRYYLTGSPICVPSVPTSLSTLEPSVCTGFGIFRGTFSIPNTVGPFSSLNVGKSQVSLVII